jgi:hypothetical protein
MPCNIWTHQIRLELSAKHLLVLEPRDVRYFAPERPLFGSEFDQKFISAGRSELNDAAKCLALSRSTAAVFHLMRIMELGIRALTACLGIPDPIKPAERNWAIMLRKIRDEGINRKWPTPADRISGDGSIVDSFYASLDAVKNPWRDPTMHVDKRYEPEDAELIFGAVRGFMMILASRCDEDGDPKA